MHGVWRSGGDTHTLGARLPRRIGAARGRRPHIAALQGPSSKAATGREVHCEFMLSNGTLTLPGRPYRERARRASALRARGSRTRKGRLTVCYVLFYSAKCLYQWGNTKRR